jgi:hypothetical protein
MPIAYSSSAYCSACFLLEDVAKLPAMTDENEMVRYYNRAGRIIDVAREDGSDVPAQISALLEALAGLLVGAGCNDEYVETLLATACEALPARIRALRAEIATRDAERARALN